MTILTSLLSLVGALIRLATGARPTPAAGPDPETILAGVKTATYRTYTLLNTRC